MGVTRGWRWTVRWPLYGLWWFLCLLVTGSTTLPWPLTLVGVLALAFLLARALARLGARRATAEAPLESPRPAL